MFIWWLKRVERERGKFENLKWENEKPDKFFLWIFFLWKIQIYTQTREKTLSLCWFMHEENEIWFAFLQIWCITAERERKNLKCGKWYDLCLITVKPQNFSKKANKRNFHFSFSFLDSRKLVKEEKHERWKL